MQPSQKINYCSQTGGVQWHKPFKAGTIASPSTSSSRYQDNTKQTPLLSMLYTTLSGTPFELMTPKGSSYLRLANSLILIIYSIWTLLRPMTPTRWLNGISMPQGLKQIQATKNTGTMDPLLNKETTYWVLFRLLMTGGNKIMWLCGWVPGWLVTIIKEEVLI